MNYWDSVGRWINTLLLFIVGIISFDTLFRLLEAQESNVIVGVTRLLASIALVPFRGMFGDQEYVLTSLVAVLGYALVVGIALSVLRGLQATRVAPRGAEDRATQAARPGPAPQRAAGSRPATRRPDPQSGRAPARNAQPGRSATAPSARTDAANRNGRPTAPPAKGTTPRRGDGATPRRADGAPPRRGDGAAPRTSDGATDGIAPRPPATAEGATTSRPNAATTDTATTRKVEPAERDSVDD